MYVSPEATHWTFWYKCPVLEEGNATSTRLSSGPSQALVSTVFHTGFPKSIMGLSGLSPRVRGHRRFKAVHSARPVFNTCSQQVCASPPPCFNPSTIPAPSPLGKFVRGIYARVAPGGGWPHRGGLACVGRAPPGGWRRAASGTARPTRPPGRSVPLLSVDVLHSLSLACCSMRVPTFDRGRIAWRTQSMRSGWSARCHFLRTKTA